MKTLKLYDPPVAQQDLNIPTVYQETFLHQYLHHYTQFFNVFQSVERFLLIP